MQFMLIAVPRIDQPLTLCLVIMVDSAVLALLSCFGHCGVLLP